MAYLRRIHVVAPRHGHPEQGKRSKDEWPNLGLAKGHALEDEHLAREVAEGDDIGPPREVEHVAVPEVIGGVHADDAGDEGPGAEEAAHERGDLVDGVARGGRGGRGDELLGRVLRVEVGRLGR